MKHHPVPIYFSKGFEEGLVARLTFSHPFLSFGSVSRSAVRVLSYTLFIILLGVIAAMLISDVGALRFLGLFLALMVIDYLLHAKKAPFRISSLSQGKVPRDNVALCCERHVIDHCAQALERAQSMGGNVRLSLAGILLEKQPLVSSLERLDIPLKEFRARFDDAYEKSCQQESTSTHAEQLEILKDIAVKSAFVARFHSRESIDDESFFVGLLFGDDPAVVRILDLFSLTREDIDGAIVYSYFIHSRKFRVPVQTGGFALSLSKIKPHRVNRTFTSRPTPTLDGFSHDLTDRARSGISGFLIGHEQEYDQLLATLSKSGTQRNVLLVGEPGVGKDALVQHLAFSIVSDAVPGPLFDRRVVELSLADLVSGASPDQLSSRLSRVVGEIIRAGNIVLFIPDLHLMAKTSGGSGIELAEMLAPVLRNASFPVIGSTTSRNFKEYLEHFGDFSSMFERVFVHEINEREATALLTYDAVVLEKKHKVAITFPAVKQTVRLCAKYLHTKPLPSSAQELLGEAVAEATQRSLKRIDGDFISSLVERKIQVPIHRASKQESQILLQLEEIIHRHYIDQQEAVESVASALRAYRSGLGAKKGPIASFLFVGPTGVGKTELSKILTDIQFGSQKLMARFDMSEYQQKDDIARFIGSSDGKVAGALTESIIQRPYSLVLLDEFEKAHPDILNLFLQVFDDGRLTDSTGRVVDFSNTIIIATSNAESVFIQEEVQKGKKAGDFDDELKKKLTAHFRPELLNRFSRIVVFEPLDMDAIVQIAKLKIDALASTIQETQGISLVIKDSALQEVARRGYEPSMGARPIDRAINDSLKNPLAKKLLSGEFVRGDEVKILYSEDAFYFEKKI